MPRHVVLLTDFGLSDPYVGQMKGSLIRHAPEARIIDLCHRVDPFNILQAAFFLAASRAHFPEETIFVSVVDPGVGGDRRIVLAEKFRQFFLAPDNGLLTFVIQQTGPALVRDVTLPWRRKASATFHGRDLFAPLAARLVNGAHPSELGKEINPNSLTRLPGAEPALTENVLEAMVLHVDRFGNCITNLEASAWGARLFKTRQVSLVSPREADLVPVLTYERLEPGQFGVIKGSQGYLELAMKQQSAGQALGLAAGSRVVLRLERR